MTAPNPSLAIYINLNELSESQADGYLTTSVSASPSPSCDCSAESKRSGVVIGATLGSVLGGGGVLAGTLYVLRRRQLSADGDSYSEIPEQDI